MAGLNRQMDIRRSSVPSGPFHGNPAFAEKITDITIEGLRRVDKEGVFKIIGSKVGEDFSEAQVTEDIETVWKKNFFRDIQVSRSHPKGVFASFG